MKLKGSLKKCLFNIDDYISVIALSGIILVTSLNVFLRFVVKSPLYWNEEVALSLFVWLTFVGMSSVMKEDGHVSIDYFVSKAPLPLRRVLSIFRYTVIYFILIFIFVYLGTGLTLETTRVTSALSISLKYTYIALPIGGVLGSIYLTIFLFKRRNLEI